MGLSLLGDACPACLHKGSRRKLSPSSEEATHLGLRLINDNEHSTAMDHSKYDQFREGFLNAPDWHYISSSDEADDENDLDGLLTPVSMTRHGNISNPSAHLIYNSSPKQGARRSSAVPLRQSRPCSSSSRRPITRSYGNDYVSLDYQRRGYVVYRPAARKI